MTAPDYRRFIAVEDKLGGFEILDDEAKRFVALEGALGGFAMDATAEADHDKPPFADRYSPDQPRVPGGPEGGQWTKGGGGEGKLPAGIVLFENDIRAKHPKVEWGQAWDKDDKPIGPPIKGTATGLTLPDTEELWGGTLSHYHPTDESHPGGTGASLSAADVVTHMDFGLRATRAFNQDGSWAELRGERTGGRFYPGESGLDSQVFAERFASHWKPAQERLYASRSSRPTGDDIPVYAREWTAAYRESIEAALPPGLKLKTGGS